MFQLPRLSLQFAEVGVLNEQTLAEFGQLELLVPTLLFRGLALIGVLLGDRFLVMLKLPSCLLQLLGQYGHLGGAAHQALLEAELVTAQTGRGDLLTLHAFSQPLTVRRGDGELLGLLLNAK